MFLWISLQHLAQMLATLHLPLRLETTMSRQTSCQQQNQQVMAVSGNSRQTFQVKSFYCQLFEIRACHIISFSIASCGLCFHCTFCAIFDIFKQIFFLWTKTAKQCSQCNSQPYKNLTSATICKGKYRYLTIAWLRTLFCLSSV